MSTTATENIEQIYDAQLKNQKSQLTQNYEQALSDIDASKETAAKQLDQNLNTAAVEAQRARKNYGEVQSAHGLSSGAMAQARLAQDNQLQADLTTLRAAHATADAELERQRTLLGQQYTAAITQAQAENDIAKAEALYKEAKEADQKLTARQESAAALMAQAGDFSLYKTLYGLTDEQIARLQSAYDSDNGKDFSGDGNVVEEWEQEVYDAVETRLNNYLAGGRGDPEDAIMTSLIDEFGVDTREFALAKAYYRELVDGQGYLKSPLKG